MAVVHRFRVLVLTIAGLVLTTEALVVEKPGYLGPEKFELGGEGGGKKICVSKGGYSSKEAARKVELARKGLL